jgi:branched-chain amino acid transport system substrate-binding protein
MKLKFSILLAALLIVPRVSAEPTKTPPIRIGGILILSGLGSQYGTHALQGATLAMDEIEKGGGINGQKLEVIWEDETGGRAERAVAAYRKLISVDGVKIIFGPTFQDGLVALAPLLERDRAFLISPSSPRLGLPRIFSTWTDPDGEAADIAKLVREKYAKVAILSGQQSWEELAASKFQEAFEALGGKITNKESPLITSTSVKSEVLKTKSRKPEAIFVSSFTLFSIYARELRAQGVQVPLYTIEADNSLLENANNKAEGTISIGPFAPESDFTRAYRARFKVDPDIPSYQAYDAMMLLAQALRSTDQSPDAVERYFTGIREYKGASGTINSKDGKISVTTSFFLAKDNKFQPISR